MRVRVTEKYTSHPSSCVRLWRNTAHEDGWGGPCPCTTLEGTGTGRVHPTNRSVRRLIPDTCAACPVRPAEAGPRYVNSVYISGFSCSSNNSLVICRNSCSVASSRCLDNRCCQCRSSMIGNIISSANRRYDPRERSVRSDRSSSRLIRSGPSLTETTCPDGCDFCFLVGIPTPFQTFVNIDYTYRVSRQDVLTALQGLPPPLHPTPARRWTRGTLVLASLRARVLKQRTHPALDSRRTHHSKIRHFPDHIRNHSLPQTHRSKSPRNHSTARTEHGPLPSTC